MNRRSFLSLLVAAPAVPALAKLRCLAPVAPPPLPPPAVLAARGLQLVERFVMGFAGDDVVEAGRIALYTAMPQLLFLPLRFLVSGLAVRQPGDDSDEPAPLEASSGFELLNVSCAGEPQLDDVIPGEAIPADFFHSAALYTPVQFDAVGPGDRIVLAVRNVTEAPRHFRAAMVGSAIR